MTSPWFQGGESNNDICCVAMVEILRFLDRVTLNGRSLLCVTLMQVGLSNLWALHSLMSIKIFGYSNWTFCFTCLFLNCEDYEVVWCFLDWWKTNGTNPRCVAGLDVSCDVRFRGKKKSEVDRFGIQMPKVETPLQFFKWKRDEHLEGLNTILVCISPWILQRKHDTMIYNWYKS